MKQLIQALTTTVEAKSLLISDNTNRSSHYDSAVVVGLGSHAFLILNQNDRDATQQQHHAQVISLVPPPPPTSSKSSEEETVDLKDDPLLDVLAVATFSVSSNQNVTMWCAVARGNKSLALYLIDPSKTTPPDVSTTSKTTTMEIHPVNIYHTSKRVGCLTFCRVPDTKEDQTAVVSDQPLLVILAGDLVGDVTAYKVEVGEIPVAAVNESTDTTISATKEDTDKDGKDEEDGAETKKDDEDGEDEEDDEETGPRRKRLLLGHTASMLTGLCLLEQHGLMLTADRDEKIRVSAFPNTFLIHGILLGHTAFVSSMAIVTLKDQPHEPLCVSVGGDGMLRLWNVTTTFQELSNVPAPFGGQDDANDASGLVPSQLAIHNTTVIVLYDQSTRVDIYDITSGNPDSSNGDKKYELQWMQTLQCPASPLSVEAAIGGAPPGKASYASFWLVCREPVYLVRLDGTQTPGCPATYQWNETDAATLSLQQAIISTVSKPTQPDISDEQQVSEGAGTANGNIVMPTSIWERDANGLLKVAKVHDKRYGGSTDTQLPTPWNRADRIEIARQRNMRHKKRRQEKSEIRYKQRKEEKRKQQEQQQQQNETSSTIESR